MICFRDNLLYQPTFRILIEKLTTNLLQYKYLIKYPIRYIITYNVHLKSFFIQYNDLKLYTSIETLQRPTVNDLLCSKPTLQ